MRRLNKVFICFYFFISTFYGRGFQRVPVHTYFFSRPLLQYGSQMSYYYNNDGDAKSSGIKIFPIYSHSFAEDDYAGALLFGDKASLLVAGDGTNNAITRDIRAEWFNGPSNYSGQLSVNPESSLSGLVCATQFCLGDLFDSRFLDRWNIGLLLPISRVHHKFHLDLAPYDFDIVSFLQDPEMNANMSDQAMSNVGLEALTFFLKSSYDAPSIFHADYYSGIEIPTQSPESAKHLWAPTLGNDAHLALLTGLNMLFHLTNDFHSKVDFFLRGEGHFFVHNHSTRVHDLFDKPFSRYLPFINKFDPQAEPVVGSQITNLSVYTHPNSFIDLATGFSANYRDMNFVLGYNLWTHSFSYQWPNLKNYGFQEPYLKMAEYGISGANNLTASKSNIKQLAADDVSFTPINFAVVDFNSGGSSSGYSNSLFGSLGFEKDDLSLRLGGWIEKGEQAAVESRYGGYLMMGYGW